MAPKPVQSETVTVTKTDLSWIDKDEEVKSPVSPVGKAMSTPDKLNKLEDSSQAEVEIVWRNIGLMIFLHSFAVYGLYLGLTLQVKILTALFGVAYTMFTGFGITAGAHRYWAHKSFKATTPLRIIMAIAQSAAFQNSIHEWCRDHRVHHKFTETHADPHNAKRGFFFSHIGWLLSKKHPDVFSKGKTVDMSDLEADSIVMFQKKYFVLLGSLAAFVVPTLIPWYFWNENLIISFSAATMLRYALTLHGTWLVNSAAHLWGDHPYDGTINPAENPFVAFFAFGEGWHNYHHVFPWDYRTGEVGPYKFNLTATNIERFARIGWAYDLKTVPETIVRQRVARTGDGTHGKYPKEINHDYDPHESAGLWGWGDPQIPQESKNLTQTLYSQKRG